MVMMIMMMMVAVVVDSPSIVSTAMTMYATTLAVA